MECRLRPVDLSRLAWNDNRFAIPGFTPAEAIARSVERCGVLSPPWLLEGDDERLVIVDGFKRLQALAGRHPAALDCLVFAAGVDERALLLRRLEGKLFGPPLNAAEKAQVVAKLATVLPAEHILRDFLPRLGLTPRADAVERWLALAGSESTLLQAMAAGIVSERAAYELAAWEESERHLALALLQVLRCSTSLQVEILERVTEIARSRRGERGEILAGAALQEILADPRANHREKTQAVRDLLQRQRYPRWWERRERFARQLLRCALPAAVRVVPPPAFEGSGWRLEISFAAPRELLKLLPSIEHWAESPELLELMGLRR
jgi:ParB family chromosome partitioning protein